MAEDRIDRILRKLGEVWHRDPDWRWGQLLVNLDIASEKNLFYKEDNEMELSLDRWLKFLKGVK